MQKSKTLYIFLPLLMFLFMCKPTKTLVKTNNQNTENNNRVVIKADSLKNTHSNGVFMAVEIQPEFPGGQKGLNFFLATNIKYPLKARIRNIHGTVYVTFITEKDGSVSNVRILRGIGGGCGKEALRVVRAMPKWKPGVQKGKNVRVQFNLPIKFILDDDKKIKKNR